MSEVPTAPAPLLPHGFCGWGGWHGPHQDVTDAGEDYWCRGMSVAGNHRRCPLCRDDLMGVHWPREDTLGPGSIKEV